MGAAQSSPPSREELLATLDSAEERTLLRNFRLLASQDAATDPTSFGPSEWAAVHAAMPPRLRGAIFRAMGGATEAIDIDAVVRTACLPMQEATAAALLLHDSQPATGQVASDCTEAAAWLSRLDSTGVPAARAAEWARVRAAFESAAPPPMSTPADRQRFAELVARNAPLLAAARVFAAAVQASWLVDHRKLQPLPSLAEGTSALLRESDLRLLSDALPPRCRQQWRLLFSSARDGASFSRFCALAVGRAPAVLVVRDTGGATFGGFCSDPLQKGPAFFGQFTCFLFGLQPAAAVHRASGENANFVYLNSGMEQLPNGLVFGGQLEARFFGLWLHDDLETGRSCAPCSTYQGMERSLSSQTDFRVDAVELWAVDDDVPVEEPEGTALDGVMGEQHAQTRAFLEMAGKKQHAAALEPV